MKILIAVAAPCLFFYTGCSASIIPSPPDLHETWKGKDCERLFGEEQRFSTGKKWQEKENYDNAFYIQQKEIRVVLKDQHRILVRGYRVGLAVADESKLYSAVRTIENATARIETVLNFLLRVQMGHYTFENIEAFDLVEIINHHDPKFAQSLADMGVIIFVIDTSNASFNLSKTACKKS